MTLKKPEQKDAPRIIKCPNCKAEISIEDLGMMMFESCTVFSCPVCTKTIAIQPKGKEFQIEGEPEEGAEED